MQSEIVTKSRVKKVTWDVSSSLGADRTTDCCVPPISKSYFPTRLRCYCQISRREKVRSQCRSLSLMRSCCMMQTVSCRQNNTVISDWWALLIDVPSQPCTQQHINPNHWVDPKTKIATTVFTTLFLPLSNLLFFRLIAGTDLFRVICKQWHLMYRQRLSWLIMRWRA